jgi:DinB superfamily
MIGRPQANEAASDYFKYINRVPGDDGLRAIESQFDESLGFFRGISEEQSLHRYGPGKWSMRQVLNHVTDTERAFAYRALWIARGFQEPLISYDQETAAAGAEADRVAWRPTPKNFAGCGRRRFHCFATCRKRRGRAAAW